MSVKYMLAYGSIVFEMFLLGSARAQSDGQLSSNFRSLNGLSATTDTLFGVGNMNLLRLDSSPKVILNVCTLVETGNSGFMIDYTRIAAAIDLAIQHSNENILPKDLRVVKLYKNAGPVCEVESVAFSRILEWMAEGVVCNVYVGPGCSDPVFDTYKAAKFQRVPVIGCPGANAVVRTNRPREDFPYLTRTSYTSMGLARTFIAFLDLFNYTHVSVITNKEDFFYQEILDGLSGRLKQLRPDIYQLSNFFDVTYDRADNRSSSGVFTKIVLGDELVQANVSSRVIIILANAISVRQVMIRAHQIGMTSGQYVYIGVELFASDTWGRFTWQQNDGDDEVARLAFRSLILISITQSYSGYMNDFRQAVRNLALERYGYSFDVFDQIDPIMLGFYDSVILYSSVVKQLYFSGKNYTDGLTVSRAMWNTSVKTPLRTVVKISSTGDRIILYDLRSFDMDLGSHSIFLRMDFSSDKVNLTWLLTLRWPSADGKLPPDVPKCGFSGLDCKADTAYTVTVIVLSTVIPVLGIMGLIAGLMYYFVLKNQQNLDPNWWRYRVDELIFPQDRAASYRNSAGKGIGASRSMGTTLTSKFSKNTFMSTVCPWTNAVCQGNVVGLKKLEEKMYRPTTDIIKELNEIQPLRHANLQRVVGLCLDDLNWIVYVMGEFCQKGCLDDLIDQKSLNLDWSFKFSLLNDTAEGMNQLHLSPVQSHGFLTSLTCLIDSRLSVKISDYGLTKLRNPAEFLAVKESDSSREYGSLLWRAPELLRIDMPPRGSQKGDVYSFAIIMQQIILRCGPFESPGADQNQIIESTTDLVLEVKKGTSPPIRPPVARSACAVELYNLMESCWSEFPIQRPTFIKIKEAIGKMGGISGGNLIDHLIKRMEKYATDLEEQVATKTEQFMEEKERSEQLLSQMLPKAVAQCLIKGESVHPEFFEMVTVYFSDIVGFTTISATCTPMDVVSLLNTLYTHFDEVVERHDAYKVETTGDAYMVSSGLPVRNGNIHAVEVAAVACEILLAVELVMIPQKPDEHLKIRSGLHSGSCVAGIVGLKTPRYCLFGDCINTASRMESTGEPMKIQTTESTKKLLQEMQAEFKISLRGQVDVKGKGMMTTYWLSR